MGKLMELVNEQFRSDAVTTSIQKESFYIRLIKKSFYLFCHIIFKFYCPLKIKGKEFLPHTPFILCSNHCSHMDSVVLILSSGLSYSSFGMIAAKDYFFEQAKNKGFSKILDLIPISRKCTKKSLIEDLAACKSFISNGERNLIIFPEGTRSLTGIMGDFKRGIAMIAIELGISIVPVYIKGTHRALPKGSFFPKPGRIQVLIDKPIDTSQYKASIESKEGYLNYRKLTKQLEKSILMLKEQHDTSQ